MAPLPEVRKMPNSCPEGKLFWLEAMEEEQLGIGGAAAIQGAWDLE